MRSDRRVRIAILDSGVDIEHPFFQHEDRKDRLKKENCRSFIGPSSVVGHEDEVGHGTHATGILLAVAPEADIYVARISQSEDLEDVSESSVTKVWNVACFSSFYTNHGS
jgi:subtilisin family serine protease